MGCVAALGSVNGYSFTTRYFGTGDGSRTLFNLAGMDSDRAYLMPLLFKQDWGGIQKLYATARTNLLLWSNDLTNASWIKRGGATMTAQAAGTGPDGISTCTLVSGLDVGAAGDIYQITTGLVGRYEPSIWIKPISTVGVIQINNASDGAKGEWRINLSALTINVWNLITRSHPAVTIITEFTDSTGNGGIQIQKTSGVGTFSLYFAYGQEEVGTISTSYVPTTTAAVTVTDYSVDTTGKVTTSPALPFNTIISYRDPHAPSGNVYRAFGMGDESAVDFSLPFVPKVPLIYKAGVLLTITTDYTHTPNGDVTMAVAPAAGALLTADFNMGPTP